MALLRIDGLSKTFLLHRVNRRVQGCQDIDFAIEPGQFVGITGKRSGSGKSTILRCIWRTMNLPERGRILYRLSALRHAGPCPGHAAPDAVPARLRAGLRLPSSSTPCRAKPPTTSMLKARWKRKAPTALSRAEEETERMLRHFDLDEGLWELYPRTFSGGGSYASTSPPP